MPELTGREVKSHRPPTLARLHRIAFSAQIGLEPQGFEDAEEFLRGLERILDGIAALLN